MYLRPNPFWDALSAYLPSGHPPQSWARRGGRGGEKVKCGEETNRSPYPTKPAVSMGVYFYFCVSLWCDLPLWRQLCGKNRGLEPLVSDSSLFVNSGASRVYSPYNVFNNVQKKNKQAYSMLYFSYAKPLFFFVRSSTFTLNLPHSRSKLELSDFKVIKVALSLILRSLACSSLPIENFKVK